MYIKKSDSKKLIKDFEKSVCNEISSTTTFLCQLLKEDDWSFIIKSHALIEATVTELITISLGNPSLKSIVERLPLSEIQTGKIAFAKQMELLSSPQITFIRFFSTLRNDLVHKVENIEFSLKDHWQGLDKNQKKSFRNKVE